MKSLFYFFIYAVILFFAFLFIYPNFAIRKYQVAVKTSLWEISEVDRNKILDDFLDKWNNDYNLDNGWSIKPSPKELTKNDSFFLLEGRFITSSVINQISQENPDLVLESKNHLLPTWVEKSLLGGKIIGIKFGLDLQGGMKVVLKSDFDSYKEKLLDIYSSEIKDLESKIKNPKDQDEKRNSELRLSEIQDLLELDSNQKLSELEKVKLIIDGRLANQNLTEPQVRIQAEQESIEVSLPGISNSNEILDVIKNTDVVEYRLDEDSKKGFLFANLISQAETELFNQSKREETDIYKFQEIIRKNLGRTEQDKFLSEMEEKYGIPSEYKIFPYWSRGAGKNSKFLPRSFVVLEKKIALTGTDFKDASHYYNPDTLNHAVSFTLTSDGTRKFYEVTKGNRGRRLSIVWGNRVVSNPTINDPIAGGRAEITGGFSQKEAENIANIISEGALPVPLEILEISFIGPTLGLESIKVGLNSILIGFILVIIYILFVYRIAGIVANIALILNITFLSALLSLFGFTLTLPGFAGIILTVGMAVDANVIIYERIKEEIRSGKSLRIAVQNGFENAFWAIIDSNATSLIAGIMMIKLGNGPIKGFAITFCWGIVTSLFSSLVFSRLLLNFLVDRIQIRTLGIK